MATKTTVSNKGVFTEKGGAQEEFVLDTPTKFRKGVQNAGAASAAISSPFVVFEGSAADVTGTLPGITAQNVGQEHKVLNSDVTEPIMVTGSNKINGALLGVGYELSGSHGATFVAVSSSAGYQWLAF